MSARRAITYDYTDDLLLLIKRRGMSVTAAAKHMNIGRSTAYRLLEEHKAREAALDVLKLGPRACE